MTNAVTVTPPEDYSSTARTVFTWVFCAMIGIGLAEFGGCDQVGEPESLLTFLGMVVGALVAGLTAVGAIVLCIELVRWWDSRSEASSA